MGWGPSYIRVKPGMDGLIIVGPLRFLKQNNVDIFRLAYVLQEVCLCSETITLRDFIFRLFAFDIKVFLFVAIVLSITSPVVAGTEA